MSAFRLMAGKDVVGLRADRSSVRWRLGPPLGTCRSRSHSILAPPCDALLARRVVKPQQQIAVTCFWRAKAQQIAAAQFIKRAQQMVLAAQPALVFGDDCCAITVNPNPKRIAPFAASSDVDRILVAACRMLVQNLAHLTLQSIRFRISFGCSGTRLATGGRRERRQSGTGATRRTRAAKYGEDPPFSVAAGGRPKTARNPKGDGVPAASRYKFGRFGET